MTVRDVCFLSDYGYRDDFAGVCRAVIRRLAPGVVVLDVTHGVPPHDVTAGAVVLRNTVPYMPDLAVHLAVVDPGVGGSRRAVAVRSSSGRLFVGPDNGLLLPAAEADGGPEEAVELTESSLWLEPVSRTFHGRDIFAPVAAALASGTALRAVGSRLPVSELRALRLPGARLIGGGLEAQVVLVDHFGNLALDCTREALLVAGLDGGVEVECGDQGYRASVGATFASVRPGELVVIVDSYGQVAVCARDESAAEAMSVAAGDVVRIRRGGGRPRG